MPSPAAIPFAGLERITQRSPSPGRRRGARRQLHAPSARCNCRSASWEWTCGEPVTVLHKSTPEAVTSAARRGTKKSSSRASARRSSTRASFGLFRSPELRQLRGAPFWATDPGSFLASVQARFRATDSEGSGRDRPRWLVPDRRGRRHPIATPRSHVTRSARNGHPWRSGCTSPQPEETTALKPTPATCWPRALPSFYLPQLQQPRSRVSRPSTRSNQRPQRHTHRSDSDRPLRSHERSGARVEHGQKRSIRPPPGALQSMDDDQHGLQTPGRRSAPS